MIRYFVALRIISIIYKIFAAFILAGTLILVSYIAVEGILPVLQGHPSGLPPSIGIEIGIEIWIVALVGILGTGLVISVSLYSFADLIDLLLAMEENTRVTALILRNISKQLQFGSAAGGAQSKVKIED